MVCVCLPPSHIQIRPLPHWCKFYKMISLVTLPRGVIYSRNITQYCCQDLCKRIIYTALLIHKDSWFLLVVFPSWDYDLWELSALFLFVCLFLFAPSLCCVLPMYQLKFLRNNWPIAWHVISGYPPSQGAVQAWLWWRRENWCCVLIWR